MADEIDGVMGQCCADPDTGPTGVEGVAMVEGIDPSMLEGVVEMPGDLPVYGIEGDVPPQPATEDTRANLPAMAAEMEVHAPESSEIRKALSNPAANDKLVEVIRRDDSTITMINTVMEEIAEEAAYIKAWRNEQWDGNKDISEATLSRIKMLSELVKALSEREKLKKDKSVGKIDFHSENFQNVLKFFMEVIMKTFHKVQVPKQYEDIFFSQLAKDFDGFEKKAEKIYYGKGK